MTLFPPTGPHGEGPGPPPYLDPGQIPVQREDWPASELRRRRRPGRGKVVLGLLLVLVVLAAAVGLVSGDGDPGADGAVNEDQCPALERARERAASEGLLAAAPTSVSSNGIEIRLDATSITATCDISYRFQISGFEEQDWNANPNAVNRNRVCGPTQTLVETLGGRGGDRVYEIGMSQWQASGTYSVSVGPMCRLLRLDFYHAGRVPEP
jgi:hypothetical protein